MAKRRPETRQKILDGVLDLLGERPFEALTTREIAAAASVSEPTLFRHFPSKSDVLKAILEVLILDFFADLEQVLSLVDDPEYQLRALTRKHAQFACRNRGLVAECQRQVSYDRFQDTDLTNRLRQFLARMDAILRVGQEQGRFRPELDRELVAVAIHGVVERTILMEGLEAQVWTEESFLATADRHLDLILQAIRIPGSPAGGSPTTGVAPR